MRARAAAAGRRSRGAIAAAGHLAVRDASAGRVNIVRGQAFVFLQLHIMLIACRPVICLAAWRCLGRLLGSLCLASRATRSLHASLESKRRDWIRSTCRAWSCLHGCFIACSLVSLLDVSRLPGQGAGMHSVRARSKLYVNFWCGGMRKRVQDLRARTRPCVMSSTGLHADDARALGTSTINMGSAFHRLAPEGRLAIWRWDGPGLRDAQIPPHPQATKQLQPHTDTVATETRRRHEIAAHSNSTFKHATAAALVRATSSVTAKGYLPCLPCDGRALRLAVSSAPRGQPSARDRALGGPARLPVRR